MDMIPTIICSSACAALVAGIIDLIKTRINRKYQKEDRQDEMLTKLNQIETRLEEHIEKDGADKASEARQRILRFADEEIRGIAHGAEYWSSILEDVDKYEDYCQAHPLYPNSKAEITIAFLKKKRAQNMSATK